LTTDLLFYINEKKKSKKFVPFNRHTSIIKNKQGFTIKTGNDEYVFKEINKGDSDGWV